MVLVLSRIAAVGTFPIHMLISVLRKITFDIATQRNGKCDKHRIEMICTHSKVGKKQNSVRLFVRHSFFSALSLSLSLTTNIIHIVRNIKNDISKMRHSLIYVMWLVVFSLLKMQRVKKIKLWKENARTTLSHTVKTCVCFLRIVCLLFKFWICNYYGWMRTVYAHCNSLNKYVISTFYVILCKYQAHDLSIIHPATLRFARLFMYYLHFRAAATTSFSINQRKQHYFVKNIA